MPNGAKRNEPACRSSSIPKTLAASKRGTHSQSTAPSGATRAPVWQSDRKAYWAIGGNGEGIAALCGILAPPGLVRPSLLETAGSFAFAAAGGDFVPALALAAIRGEPLARLAGLMIPPTARASRRTPPPSSPPPRDPSCRAHRGAREVASRVAGRRCATSL